MINAISKCCYFLCIYTHICMHIHIYSDPLGDEGHYIRTCFSTSEQTEDGQTPLVMGHYLFCGVYFTWRISTRSIVTYGEADSIFQGGRKRSRLADSFILCIWFFWKTKLKQGHFHFIEKKCKQNTMQSGNQLNMQTHEYG